MTPGQAGGRRRNCAAVCSRKRAASLASSPDAANLRACCESEARPEWMAFWASNLGMDLHATRNPSTVENFPSTTRRARLRARTGSVWGGHTSFRFVSDDLKPHCFHASRFTHHASIHVKLVIWTCSGIGSYVISSSR